MVLSKPGVCLACHRPHRDGSVSRVPAFRLHTHATEAEPQHAHHVGGKHRLSQFQTNGFESTVLSRSCQIETRALSTRGQPDVFNLVYRPYHEEGEEHRRAERDAWLANCRGMQVDI